MYEVKLSRLQSLNDELTSHLVETEYLSGRWTQSTPATVILLTSSFFIPMLEPLMVTEIRPFRGPKRGMICKRQDEKKVPFNAFLILL